MANLGGDVRFDIDAEEARRLAQEGRLLPYKHLVHALSTSMSYQAGQVRDSETAMAGSAILVAACAAIGVITYLSMAFGTALLAGIGAVSCAIKFSIAKGRRDASKSELILMEERLLDSGFHLVWSKGPGPFYTVTLSWSKR